MKKHLYQIYMLLNQQCVKENKSPLVKSHRECIDQNTIQSRLTDNLTYITLYEVQETALIL